MKRFQDFGSFKRTFARQLGVTLFELLVVLAIISLASGIAGASLKRALPALSVRQAASVLEADLQRARTRSLIESEPVRLNFFEDGYKIKKLELNRTLPSGVLLIWNGERPLFFASGIPSSGGTIGVTRGDRNVQIHIEPFTGRVSREAPQQ